MFKSSAEKITRILANSGIIAESDYELYSFGFEMGFAQVTFLLTAVFIGLLIHMPIESLIFLVAFTPLRSYVGGFHASSYFRCYWLSALAVIVVLITVRFVLRAYHIAVILIIGLICAAVMFVLVPVQDPNRHLEEIEVRIYGKRAKIMLGMEFICGSQAISSVCQYSRFSTPPRAFSPVLK